MHRYVSESQGRAESQEKEAHMPETQELQEATEGDDALGKLETTGGYYSETTVRMQKRAAVTFSQDEKVLKLEFLRDNVLFYNKHLMDYKDPMKRGSSGTMVVHSMAWTRTFASIGFSPKGLCVEGLLA